MHQKTTNEPRISFLRVKTDGASATARGAKFELFLKKNGSVTLNKVLLIEESSKVTLNPSALVGGDVEILSETSLTSTNTVSFDVSTGRTNFTPLVKFDGRIFHESAEVQTTDATVTTLTSLTLEDENVYHVKVKATAVQSDGANRASYEKIITVFRTAAGSATIQGAITIIHEIESNASWDLTLDVSGNDLRVRVTGIAATTIEWGCQLEFENISN